MCLISKLISIILSRNYPNDYSTVLTLVAKRWSYETYQDIPPVFKTLILLCIFKSMYVL